MGKRRSRAKRTPRRPNANANNNNNSVDPLAPPLNNHNANGNPAPHGPLAQAPPAAAAQVLPPPARGPDSPALRAHNEDCVLELEHEARLMEQAHIEKEGTRQHLIDCHEQESDRHLEAVRAALGLGADSQAIVALFDRFSTERENETRQITQAHMKQEGDRQHLKDRHRQERNRDTEAAEHAALGSGADSPRILALFERFHLKREKRENETRLLQQAHIKKEATHRHLINRNQQQRNRRFDTELSALGSPTFASSGFPINQETVD